MIILFFLIQLLISQEIEFEVRDNSLYNYDNYKYGDEKSIFGYEIDLDSVRFYNSSLGIDTTLIYSKYIDLKDILVVNSLNYDNQSLQPKITNELFSVISKENIENITIYDYLGREIINKSINGKEANFSYNFNDFIYFVKIRTEKNIYNNKLIKSISSNIFTNSIIMNENDWEITLYKFAFKPKTLNYTSIPSKIETELNRKVFKVSYLVSIDSIKVKRVDRLNNIYSTDTVNLNLNKYENLIYDSISSPGIKFYCLDYSEFFKERASNSYVANLNKKRIFYNIDSLYNFSEIVMEYCDSKNYDLYAEFLRIELLEEINLQPIFNGELNTMSYLIENDSTIWDYKYANEFVYSPNTFKSEHYSKISSSKISITILISIVD